MAVASKGARATRRGGEVSRVPFELLLEFSIACEQDHDIVRESNREGCICLTKGIERRSKQKRAPLNMDVVAQVLMTTMS